LQLDLGVSAGPGSFPLPILYPRPGASTVTALTAIAVSIAAVTGATSVAAAITTVATGTAAGTAA
jgi:hypothetical protein